MRLKMLTRSDSDAHTSINMQRPLPTVSVKVTECCTKTGIPRYVIMFLCKAKSQIGSKTRLPTTKHPATLRKSKTANSGQYVFTFHSNYTNFGELQSFNNITMQHHLLYIFVVSTDQQTLVQSNRRLNMHTMVAAITNLLIYCHHIT